MKKDEKEIISKKVWIILLVVCILLIIIVSVGFYVFNHREEEVIEKKEDGAKIYLNYTSTSPSFSLTKLVPTADEVGMNSEEMFYDFSVEAEIIKADEVEYEISIEKDLKLSNISNDDIRIYLEKEDSGTYVKKFGPDKYTPLKEKSDLGSEINSMILWKDSMKKSDVHNYRLKIWLADKSLLTSGMYKVDVVVNGKSK